MKTLLVFGSLAVIFMCLICGGGVGAYFVFFRSGSDTQYLPNNFDSVVVVDYDALRSSPAWSALQNCPDRLAGGKLPGKKADDVSKLMIGRIGSESVAVITLKRNATIQDFAEGKTAREYQLAGKTVHEVNKQTVFIGGKTAVVGPEANIKQILERKGSARLTDKMKKAMREASFSKPMVAVVTFNEAAAGMLGGRGESGGDIPEYMVVSADFRMPMTEVIKGFCRDSATASRLAADAQRDFKEGEVKVSTSGSTVTIERTVSDPCKGMGLGF